MVVPILIPRMSACSCSISLFSVIPPSTRTELRGSSESWFIASKICIHVEKVRKLLREKTFLMLASKYMQIHNNDLKMVINYRATCSNWPMSKTRSLGAEQCDIIIILIYQFISYIPSSDLLFCGYEVNLWCNL